MNRNWNRIVAIILFACTAAVYSRAVWYPFALIDDPDYVANNVHVTSGLSLQAVQWAFTTFHAGNWHPLTWLSLMVDSQLFGAGPMGFHLVNITLHALSASLLFLLLTSLTGALWRSAFVAALFAVHPLHVESVVWISERKDVLSALLFMITLILYSSYAMHSKQRRYFYSLAAFALGLMAKPMLVTTPFLLLLLDVWPLERFAMPGSDAVTRHGDVCGKPGNGHAGWVRLLVEKIPFFALSFISAALTWYAHGAYMIAMSEVPLMVRVNNALWSMVVYVRKMFFPSDLAMFYPLAPIPFWKAGCAALLLGTVTLIVLRALKKYPYLAVGWFWYAITLIPVIGLVQVGNQAMADRYAYLPLIGLYIMVAWGGGELYRRVQKFSVVIPVTAAAAVLLLAGATCVQSGYWRDNAVLSAHALEVTDNNYFAHFTLGLAYGREGKNELAVTQFKEALKINPADSQSYFNLGLTLANSGKLAESVEYFENSIRLNPQFANVHYCLGATLARLGKVDAAIGEYDSALKIEPDNNKYLNNMGSLLARQGRYDEAIPYFSTIVRLYPNDDKARHNLELAIRLKDQTKGK